MRFRVADALGITALVAVVLLMFVVSSKIRWLEDAAWRDVHRIAVTESAIQELALDRVDGGKSVIVIRKPLEENDEFAKRASEVSGYKVAPNGRMVMRIPVRDPKAAHLVATHNYSPPGSWFVDDLPKPEPTQVINLDGTPYVSSAK